MDMIPYQGKRRRKMKKCKLLLLLFLVVLITGCTKDNMEDIEIITTSYPIEYITTRLYGEHALINSVYPDGTDIRSYEITDKQLDDYSTKDLFIYNGLGEEREIAIQLLDRNKNLKIIDSASVLETTYGIEELWLNPSHLLMITQNIRTGLNEYITSNVLKKEIDENYETLKVELSELDADIKLIAENATNKTIVVSNDVLKYLEKYGFQVISLEENESLLDKTVDEVRTMIENQEINYIFLLEHEDVNDTIQSLIDETDIQTVTFRRLDNITDQERDNKDDYLTIMNQNLELLRQETYQ